jgi:nucleotide-binding universal stress UspA family protein
MYKNILLPVDISEDDSWKRALEIAVEYAQAFGSHLHVMTVVPDSGMAMVSQYFSKDAVNRIIEATNQSLHAFVEGNIPKNIRVQHIVTTGNVYESIIDTAKKINADLIVMSAHRPELKDYLLGPNAARVVRHSDRSVLVVRNQE